MTNQNNKMLQRLITALNPDWTIRGEYIGRITQKEKVLVFAPDGTPIETEVEIHISLDTIKAVLELVKKKADLPDDFRVQTEPQIDG